MVLVIFNFSDHVSFISVASAIHVTGYAVCWKEELVFYYYCFNNSLQIYNMLYLYSHLQVMLKRAVCVHVLPAPLTVTA